MKSAQYLLVFFAMTLWVGSGLQAQNLVSGPDKESAIRWMSWEEALEKSRTAPRKIILDVYTVGCGWCKRMDNVTFNNSYIANFINEHFYPVKLDAEEKRELIYKDKSYRFVRSSPRGYHELAAEMLRGRLSFPSVVFLDEEQNVIQSIVGYKTPAEFERITTYFGKDHYKTMPWSAFQKTYQPVIKE